MGKAISGKKTKTQRKKANPEFAYRRKCCVPLTTNEREATKFQRRLRQCASSEEDTDPGVEVYNKDWTLEQQKEADKKIKQILQEGEHLFADPNCFRLRRSDYHFSGCRQSKKNPCLNIRHNKDCCPRSGYGNDCCQTPPAYCECNGCYRLRLRSNRQGTMPTMPTTKIGQLTI